MQENATDCPMPPKGAREAQILAWGLDLYVRYGPACTQELFNAHQSTITQYKEPLQPNYEGSWNKPVLAWSTWLIATGSDEPAQLLIEYARGQLGKDGLWGREILSWLYWWPLPALGLVYDWLASSGGTADQLDSQTREELTDCLTRLLTVHALTLSLFALPEPIPSGSTSTPEPLPLVWCPGIRTLPGDITNAGLTYFFNSLLTPGLALPSTYDVSDFWAWPWRVTHALTQGYLDDTTRSKLTTQQQTGSEASWVVGQLEQYPDLHFQARVRAWRYQSGDFCALITHNTHNTKPPVVGVTFLQASFQEGKAPLLLRGEDNKPPGAKREGSQIIYQLNETSIVAPDPQQPLLYEVQIQPDTGGQGGIVLVS